MPDARDDDDARPEDGLRRDTDPGTVVPCQPVERGHIAEARRALLAQGRSAEALDDGAIAAALWLARALPAVLDVLSDVRAPKPLDQVRLLSARLEVKDGRAPDRGPLLLVASLIDQAVVVRVIDGKSEAPLVAAPRLVLTFPWTALPGADDEGEGPVALRRFVVGRPT